MFFCGIPEFITLPKTVKIIFPEVVNLLQACNIKIIKTTSGFQAGIRDIRTWEDQIRFTIRLRDGLVHISELVRDAPKISSYISSRYDKEKSKVKKWFSSIDKLIVPPEKDEFLKLYCS
jgi:hypothetical protein